MADDATFPTMRTPARDVPIPAHLSAEARAQLSMTMLANPPWPEVDDVPAWRALVERMDQMGEAGLSMMAQSVDADVEEIDVDGVRVFVATPRGLPANDRSVYLDIHGGALLWGGGRSCRAMGIITAGMVGAQVWAVDYRLPPEHPYPAPVDDVVTVYRALLRDREPGEIIIGGSSAGGNIAAAAVLKARDSGLPLPAATVLMTPELDLTESGDTFNTLLGVDTALTSRLMPANLVYAGGHDLADPYLSPLFGDFTKGFPPTLLRSGTRDLFLSNTVRMHAALRAADVPADLHVIEAATHIMFFACREGEAFNRQLRRFLDQHWSRGTCHSIVNNEGEE